MTKPIALKAFEAAPQRIISQVDNHTSDRFGGFLHELPPIVTAEELMEQLDHKIRIEDLLADTPTPVMQAAFRDKFNAYAKIGVISPVDMGGKVDVMREMTRVTARQHEMQLPAYGGNYFAHGASGSMTLERDPHQKHYLKPDYEIPSPLYEQMRKSYEALGMYFSAMSAQPTPEPAPFDVSSQVRTKHWTDADAAIKWAALQTLTEPSIHDEDLLWNGFDEGLNRLPPDTQFFCIGDTNHNDAKLQKWLKYDMPFLPALKAQGFEDVVLEVNEIFEVPMRMYAQSANRKDALVGCYTAIHDRLHNLGCKHENIKAHVIELLARAAAIHDAGLRFHCLDKQTQQDGVNISVTDRFAHEKGLAARIKARVGDRKTAIIYGSAHFAYKDWLIDELGRDKCHVTTIHADLKTYRAASADCNITYLPDRCFLIHDYTDAQIKADPKLSRLKPATIKPHAKYGRMVPPTQDPMLQAVMGAAQRAEIKKFADMAAKIIFKRAQEGRNTMVNVAAILLAKPMAWLKHGQDHLLLAAAPTNRPKTLRIPAP